jgi:hypothetical protein
VVIHTCNPSTQEAEAEEVFEAGLVYIVSSRSLGILVKLCLKKKKKKKRLERDFKYLVHTMVGLESLKSVKQASSGKF